MDASMRLLSLLALALLAAPPLRAQADGPVPQRVVPGARVRVLEAGPAARRFTGTVARADSARLEVVTGENGRVLAWERVELIEVSRGRRSFRYGATGLALGAIFGALLYKSYADEYYPDGDLNGLAAVFEGAPPGALAGLGVGLAMGREKWRPVGGTSFRPFVSPAAGAGVSLRVR
jgi:hypothetical protein